MAGRQQPGHNRRQRPTATLWALPPHVEQRASPRGLTSDQSRDHSCLQLATFPRKTPVQIQPNSCLCLVRACIRPLAPDRNTTSTAHQTAFLFLRCRHHPSVISPPPSIQHRTHITHHGAYCRSLGPGRCPASLPRRLKIWGHLEILPLKSTDLQAEPPLSCRNLEVSGFDNPSQHLSTAISS